MHREILHNTKSFGPFPSSIEKSLDRVFSILSPTGRVRWIYDASGSTVNRIAALSCMLSELEHLIGTATGSRDHIITVFALYLNGPAPHRAFPEETINAFGLPLDLAAMLGCPGRSANELRDILAMELQHTSTSFKRERLQYQSHNSAVRPLWSHDLPKVPSHLQIKCTALIVDDQVGHPGSRGFISVRSAAKKLMSWGWHVFLTPTIRDASNRRFWQYSHIEDIFLVEYNAVIPFEHFEVIFLDIARPSLDENIDIISIEGLRNDLIELSQVRSVLRFPQIYMLSHIMDELIAHLCYALGADYYFEKSNFLHMNEMEFWRIFSHTVYMGRGFSGDALLRASYNSPDPIVDSRTNKIVDPTPINTAQRNTLPKYANMEQMDRIRQLVNQVFRRTFANVNVEFITSHGEGFSGAMVFTVRPSQLDSKNSPPSKQKMRIVKIANLDELAREMIAHNSLVYPYVSFGFARVEQHWAVDKGAGVISYERAGNTPDAEVKTLEGVFQNDIRYKSLASTHISRLLAELLSSLKLLHHQGKYQPIMMQERAAWEYGRFLLKPFSWPADSSDHSEHLPKREYMVLSVKGGTLDGLSPDRTVVGIHKCETVEDVATWTLQNPTMERELGPGVFVRRNKLFRSAAIKSKSCLFQSATSAIDSRLDGISVPDLHNDRINECRCFIDQLRLSDRLEHLARLSFASNKLSVPWGAVHGDLRLANIMVDDTFESFWIIDYGRTGTGPLMLDYAQLAFDIRLHYLTPRIWIELDSIDDISSWMDAVKNCIYSMEKLISDTDEPTDCWGIQTIRSLYSTYLGTSTVPEMLFLMRVLQLYFGETKNIYGPLIFSWAAILLDLLLAKAGVPNAPDDGQI